MSVTFRVACGCLLAVALWLVSVHSGRAADKSPLTVVHLPPVTEEAEGKADAPKAAEKVPAADAPKKSASAAKPLPKPKQLSPEMAERRDRVRRLLKALREQPFNTQQNDCSDILEFCRGFGCDTELTDNAGTGQKINGITCLCWNLPCAGCELMTLSRGHLAPRVGYGYQGQSSELAAVLALSGVPPEYPVRCGAVQRTVADMIEYEKLTCRSGTDMSLKLVALAHYARQPSWKDSLGGQWTLRRVVAEELTRPSGALPYAGTNRLLGLVSAVNRFKADKAPLDGELARATSYIADSTVYAYSSQNTDGSWGKPINRDYPTAISATAHMLQWLVATEPANGLENPHMLQGIDFLTTAYNTPHYQNYISTMSAVEISAAMHTAYVLNVYDQRVFVPADPPPEAPPAKGEKDEQKSAARERLSR